MGWRSIGRGILRMCRCGFGDGLEDELRIDSCLLLLALQSVGYDL